MSISFENYEKCVQALKSSINGSPKAIDALIKETQARGFSPDHIRTSIGRLMVGENSGKYQQNVEGGTTYIREVI